jgi:hypothetical protein
VRPLGALAAGDGAAVQAGIELSLEAVMFEGLFQSMHLLVILVIVLARVRPEKAG